MRFVFLGLSLSSSWGNGHATTYRALLRALAGRGHEITFLERDQPWYAENRDLPAPDFCDLRFYASVRGLDAFKAEVARADAVIVGSYVPEGVRVADWADATRRGALCFYDIDTPVTLRKLETNDTEYLAPHTIPKFDLYLSFTGGPTLRVLERRYGAKRARALYCSADPALYYPTRAPRRWDLGYLGTYSPDRQEALERLLLAPARLLPAQRFVVAGPQYPEGIAWPTNVDRIEHLAPGDHADFYSALGWTLNVTRRDMIQAGYSPSVRLFEATSCGVPVISDIWPGLETVFRPGRELLAVAGSAEVIAALSLPEAQRAAIGEAGRCRTLRDHTAERRAADLEAWLCEAEEAWPVAERLTG